MKTGDLLYFVNIDGDILTFVYLGENVKNNKVHTLCDENENPFSVSTLDLHHYKTDYKEAVKEAIAILDEKINFYKKQLL